MRTSTTFRSSTATQSISGITYMLRSRTPDTGGTAWRTASGSGIARSAPAACKDGPSASRKKSAAQNVHGRAALAAVLAHATVANASAVYPTYAVCSVKFPANVARVARTSGPANQWSYAGRKNARRSTLHWRISSSDDCSGACGGMGLGRSTNGTSSTTATGTTIAANDAAAAASRRGGSSRRVSMSRSGTRTAVNSVRNTASYQYASIDTENTAAAASALARVGSSSVFSRKST